MEEKAKETFTPLHQLGEFKLIKELTQGFENRQSSTLLGIGDDAAVIEPISGQTLITTDTLVEGVHFDLTYVHPKHLGYKAMVVNFSDLCAMNGLPTQVTVGLGVSNRFGLEFLKELYAGIQTACDIYEVDLIGGDTVSSFSGLALHITAIGQADANRIVRRNGAKENDLVVVSGDLGGAYMGLQILEREKAVFKENPDMQPELKGYDYALERQLKPEARKDIIDILEKLEVLPTAMIDISDGLSSEVLHLSEQSGHGFAIYEEKIPIDPTIYKVCEEFDLTTTTVALNGGEDYELLFTVSPADHDKIKDNPHLTVIGHVTEEGGTCNLVTRDSKLMPLQAQGWQSLKA
jgi:thiamine-monophosphate kinase